MVEREKRAYEKPKSQNLEYSQKRQKSPNPANITWPPTMKQVMKEISQRKVVIAVTQAAIEKLTVDSLSTQLFVEETRFKSRAPTDQTEYNLSIIMLNFKNQER